MSFGDEMCASEKECVYCGRRRPVLAKLCACGYVAADPVAPPPSAELERASMRDTLDLANRLLWKLGRKVNHR